MKVIVSLLLLSCFVPAAYGAQRRGVSNAGVIASCPSRYTTIQAAVNAAVAGDNVVVCNTGVPYNEQVVIAKSIKLTGQTGAIIQPNPMVANTTSLYDGSPIAAAVVVQATTGVTISDLIVDGSQNGITGCSPDLMGVYFRNASGTIADSAVRNFKLGSGLEGCQSGEGIFAQADDSGGISNVTATANSVHDFQKNGITGNEVGTTLTATSNIVTGIGPTPNIAQNGIQIGFGAAGTVTGNTVSNVVYSPCTDTSNCTASSTGILIYDPTGGVATHTNNVSTTQGAVYYLSASNGSIDTNTISNTLVFDGIGIDVDPNTSNPGTGNTVSQNTIMNSSESGVYVNTDSNSVTSNTIIETPIGIWFHDTTGNTQTSNAFFATPVTVHLGASPDGAGHPWPGSMKLKPAR